MLRRRKRRSLANLHASNSDARKNIAGLYDMIRASYMMWLGHGRPTLAALFSAHL
jgi:hypothetical protein